MEDRTEDFVELPFQFPYFDLKDPLGLTKSDAAWNWMVRVSSKSSSQRPAPAPSRPVQIVPHRTKPPQAVSPRTNPPQAVPPRSKSPQAVPPRSKPPQAMPAPSKPVQSVPVSLGDCPGGPRKKCQLLRPGNRPRKLGMDLDQLIDAMSQPRRLSPKKTVPNTKTSEKENLYHQSHPQPQRQKRPREEEQCQDNVRRQKTRLY